MSSSSVARHFHPKGAAVLSAAAALLVGALSASEATAQQAGWSRKAAQGIESGPLPVPDPTMGSGNLPQYAQPLGDTMPDPGDIAPDNGQSFTIFNRRF
jgi:hypothetical protein